MTNHSTPCDRRTLAANRFALLEVCSCDSVHLTIGAITLRLQAEALPALAAVLSDAARELSLERVLAEHDALRRVFS